MKAATFPFAVALAVANCIASAQGASEPTPQSPGCSLMQWTDRSECLDKLPRRATPPLQLALAGDNWVVTETTSPIDYSPIATATTSSSRDAGGPPMQLAIRCRGGRTELAVTGSVTAGRGDDYLISYRVNGGQSVQLAGGVPAFGDGVAFKGDAVALLLSLPADGELAVRLLPQKGRELDGVFSLHGLETLRARIGATCKWPHAVAKPNDR
ncbi:hypothetical protein AS156_33075 [Bradyrhizobium macuxiense]|uniref:Uncharacterized protein n=1 Tax=Bradyrhizobium macuxiense TaxID=1755647 RepID=A0A109K1H5_9BRAD|nr:hypothetical protein [Bradyrhizobium macuxiense]KWV59018.1 hypothetical protein AS156_33075 [Bradyrhizobium macuxiense]